MPNCVVKGCKKQSSKDTKQHGITFHTFPIRDQKMKQKWIQIIAQSRKDLSWQATASSVVCSAHFKVGDLYYTKKGLRRVVKNGYPKILPNIKEELDNVPPTNLIQPPIVKEEPAALDLSKDLNVSQPSSLCDVQTAAADLSVMGFYQPSISYAVQPVQSDPPIFDTLKKYTLRQRVLLLETKLKKYKRKIKTLHQNVRRLHKRNKSLREILVNLKKQN